MAIHTEQELRHELDNNGSINLSVVKAMMRVLLDIIDTQAERIDNLESQISHVRGRL